MNSKFERDTAVTQTQDSVWEAQLSPDWCVNTVPNGGYLMAVGAKALSQAIPHKDPLTINAYFFARTQAGPVKCEVEVIRVGGSTSYAMVRMFQKGEQQNEELKVQLIAAYTDLDKLHGDDHIMQQCPNIVAFDDCVRIPAKSEITLAQQVVQRVVPGQEQMMQGEPDGSGVLSGWMDFADAGPKDVFSLLLFADATPPPVFSFFGPVHWVPTLELNVQLRAKPEPGPIQFQFSTRFLTRGVVEEDGLLWDSAGNIVALSRQTAKFRRS